MYVNEYLACMGTTCRPGACEGQEGVGLLRAGVTGGCEVLCECLKRSPCSLQSSNAGLLGHLSSLSWGCLERDLAIGLACLELTM